MNQNFYRSHLNERRAEVVLHVSYAWLSLRLITPKKKVLCFLKQQSYLGKEGFLFGKRPGDVVSAHGLVSSIFSLISASEAGYWGGIQC